MYLFSVLRLPGQFLLDPSLYPHWGQMLASLKLYGSHFPVTVISYILSNLPSFWEDLFSSARFQTKQTASLQHLRVMVQKIILFLQLSKEIKAI